MKFFGVDLSEKIVLVQDASSSVAMLISWRLAAVPDPSAATPPHQAQKTKNTNRFVIVRTKKKDAKPHYRATEIRRIVSGYLLTHG